jgi:hypothetical protein
MSLSGFRPPHFSLPPVVERPVNPLRLPRKFPWRSPISPRIRRVMECNSFSLCRQRPSLAIASRRHPLLKSFEAL